MKIALINDTHFGARGDSDLFIEHQKQFYNDTFFPTLKEQGIDTIIIGGDCFEKRKNINFVTLTEAYKFFFEVINEFATTHILVGNHDCYYKNTNLVNSPSILLNQYQNIHVYSEPKSLYLNSCHIDLIPWINDENHTDTMEFIKNSKCDLMYGHFELAGFLHNGATTEIGMKPDFLKHIPMVVSGHYHTKKLPYLGSPYQFTWADHGEKKGFHIFDTQTKKLDFIENPHQLFHKIDYTDDLMIEDEDYKDKFVKLVVKQDVDQQKLENTLTELNKQAFDLQHIDTTLQELSDIEINQDEIKDTKQIMMSVVDNIDDLKDEAKLEVKQILSELHQEALVEV